MSHTMKAMSDNSNRPDVLIVAGEVVALQYDKWPVSLRAQKLLHLLVHASGLNARTTMQHEILAEELNSHFHLSLEKLVESCRELQTCMVALPRKTANGQTTLEKSPLLSHVEHDGVDGDARSGATMIRWIFSPLLREVLGNSTHWAALSRKAVLAIDGRYSLRLYEWLTLMKGLKFKSEDRLTLNALRARLGVEEGKLKTWSEFRIRALEPAIAEVVHLSGLTVSYSTVAIGKRVVAVIIRWKRASSESRKAAEHEVEASRVDRKARRGQRVKCAMNNDMEKHLVKAGRQKTLTWSVCS